MIKQTPDRIKAKFLRDIKTEALLVFIKTTLEHSIKDIKKHNEFLKMKDLYNKEVIESLSILNNSLNKHIINSAYLQLLIKNSSKSKSLQVMAKSEEALMVYYDSIVKELERNLTNGSKWIPEMIVICLLSEWLVEEEKSTNLFPFLLEHDYIKLLNYYDETKLTSKEEEKSIIMDMYKLSSNLIEKLKNTKYKINTKRVSKNRKRRRA